MWLISTPSSQFRKAFGICGRILLHQTLIRSAPVKVNGDFQLAATWIIGWQYCWENCKHDNQTWYLIVQYTAEPAKKWRWLYSRPSSSHSYRAGMPENILLPLKAAFTHALISISLKLRCRSWIPCTITAALEAAHENEIRIRCA